MATAGKEGNPFTGVFFLGFKADGSCVVKGMGEIDSEDAEDIAKKLILMASRLRNAAREPPGMLMLH